jgi:hypothetical protein
MTPATSFFKKIRKLLFASLLLAIFFAAMK